ncbi:MAG: alpha/beta hydrolase [Bacteroidia bacterium]|nr:MAG: alpha/beta hydrolase [Bacteroidia bacterium]
MKKKRLGIAIQGGGAHGAFTWGMLERLLDLPDLEVVGVVGTSAGAMNASCLAYGLNSGGPEKAKEILATFWKKISQKSKYSLLQPSFLDLMMHKGDMDFSPGYNLFTMMTHLFSPYQLNPLNINPLKDVIEEVIDFDVLKQAYQPKLFLCATNVLTCKPKVFMGQELSADACMASACLPFMFQAVEIDGNAYWDGGYMGNPPIFPLIKYTDVDDILILKINPIKIKNIPKTSKDIEDRINEISFNSSLMAEIKMVHFINQLIDKGILIEGLRKIRFHAISADEALEDFSISSKLNASWDFIEHLYGLGRRYAKEWIEENYQFVGEKETIDVQKVFL